jgi:hypothetical protein
MEELMNQMPDEAAEIFLHLIFKEQSKKIIKGLKIWIAELDDDSHLDIMLSNIVYFLISQIGLEIEELIKDSENMKMDGKRAGEIAMKKLRDCANSIESATIEGSQVGPMWH